MQRLAILLICGLGLATISLQGQGGFHFGIKAGPTLANQTWNQGERSGLFTYHGNLFVESRDPNDRGSLYAQLGLHNRGSSFGFTVIGGGNTQLGYEFQNVSLQAGIKKNVASSLNMQPYYFAGIRGEYQLSNNLREIIESRCTGSFLVNCAFFPDPVFINDFTYGITIGGGLYLSETKYFSPSLEFAFSPDLSFQYQQPSLGNIPDPQGGTQTIGERQIRNVSFEISLVIRFLREVIYEE